MMKSPMTTETIIRDKLLYIQNQWVILDRDLAQHLGLETKRLLERCKRNANILSTQHFFQLEKEEIDALWSQIATANKDINISNKSRTLPFVFTKPGIEILKLIFKKSEQIQQLETILETFEEKENKPLSKICATEDYQHLTKMLELEPF